MPPSSASYDGGGAAAGEDLEAAGADATAWWYAGGGGRDAGGAGSSSLSVRSASSAAYSSSSSLSSNLTCLMPSFFNSPSRSSGSMLSDVSSSKCQCASATGCTATATPPPARVPAQATQLLRLKRTGRGPPTREPQKPPGRRHRTLGFRAAWHAKNSRSPICGIVMIRCASQHHTSGSDDRRLLC